MVGCTEIPTQTCCRSPTGCMLVELATGAPLFPGESDIDQLWLIIKVCHALGLAIQLWPACSHPTENTSAAGGTSVPLMCCESTISPAVGGHVCTKTNCGHDTVIPRLTYPAPLEPGSQAAVGLTSTAMGDLAGISGAVSFLHLRNCLMALSVSQGRTPTAL